MSGVPRLGFQLPRIEAGHLTSLGLHNPHHSGVETVFRAGRNFRIQNIISAVSKVVSFGIRLLWT